MNYKNLPSVLAYIEVPLEIVRYCVHFPFASVGFKNMQAAVRPHSADPWHWASIEKSLS